MDSEIAHSTLDQHQQWVVFSLRFFVAAALGVKTEREVRLLVDSAVDEAHAARQYILDQGGLHIDASALKFPRPELSLVPEPAPETEAETETPA